MCPGVNMSLSPPRLRRRALICSMMTAIDAQRPRV
jgi:hypothetical protein